MCTAVAVGQRCAPKRFAGASGHRVGQYVVQLQRARVARQGALRVRRAIASVNMQCSCGGPALRAKALCGCVGSPRRPICSAVAAGRRCALTRFAGASVRRFDQYAVQVSRASASPQPLDHAHHASAWVRSLEPARDASVSPQRIGLASRPSASGHCLAPMRCATGAFRLGEPGGRANEACKRTVPMRRGKGPCQ